MVSKLKTSITLKEALHQEEDTQQQILSWSKDSAAAVSKIIALTLYGQRSSHDSGFRIPFQIPFRVLYPACRHWLAMGSTAWLSLAMGSTAYGSLDTYWQWAAQHMASIWPSRHLLAMGSTAYGPLDTYWQWALTGNGQHSIWPFRH